MAANGSPIRRMLPRSCLATRYAAVPVPAMSRTSAARLITMTLRARCRRGGLGGGQGASSSGSHVTSGTADRIPSPGSVIPGSDVPG